MRTRIIKKIVPKTEKAREFVKKFGDEFVSVAILRGNGVWIRSIKTGDALLIEVRADGCGYIDGEKVNWEEK